MRETAAQIVTFVGLCEHHGDEENDVRRPKLDLLTKEDVSKIVAASYDLLETFGVMVDNQEALQALADGFCQLPEL